MPFDEENTPEGYSCECGGSILFYDGMWCCDECNFKAPDNHKKIEPKLPELLCKSKLDEGVYDNIIREHIGVMLRAIMSQSKGTENPTKVLERIKTLV